MRPTNLCMRKTSVFSFRANQKSSWAHQVKPALQQLWLGRQQIHRGFWQPVEENGSAGTARSHLDYDLEIKSHEQSQQSE